MKILQMPAVILIMYFGMLCQAQNAAITPNDRFDLAVSKNEKIERVEPPNWWVGFKNDSLQLLIKHDGIGDYTPIINYPGVRILNVQPADRSHNYLFIDLLISRQALAGTLDIQFKSKDGNTISTPYELKSREKAATNYVGFNSSDAIYLITPDRFANANPDNDSVEGMLETKVDRKNDYARHGGDIQGITKHLDYISDLGFTAIWSQPLLTNDMKSASYHGYAITDYYQIDPRFGTLADYQNLSQKAKEKGLKLIMDQVVNHCGLEHWWMKDLPFSDWVNLQQHYEKNRDQWSNKTNISSNHRRTTNQDPYASDYDRQGNSEGWFVASMPDLNQRNPFMANYLIQNSIWWIETAKLDGIRQDTYPYPDKSFMSRWAGAIMNEYPNFSIVGEEWTLNPLLIGYWQDGQSNKDAYQSNLKSTMDFAMQANVVKALNQEESWDQGLVHIYEGLANDFHYVRPRDIMVFPDNHDMSRIFTQLNGDIPNTKMALASYAVLPRILQMYYGTEILMADFEKPGDHGLIRTDYPGGWEGDKVNAFTGKGLRPDQKDMKQFLGRVLNYRKDSDALHKGKTIHFAPVKGTYTLVRTYEDETVILILNKNNEPIRLDLKPYQELGLTGKTFRNIVTDDIITWDETLQLKERGPLLLSSKIK